MMARCSTSPTPSETPMSTPVVTPSPMPCPECTCFSLISTEPFTINIFNCGSLQSEQFIAQETFPGQWTIGVCADSYELVSGVIDEEYTTNCFYEQGWSCPV